MASASRSGSRQVAQDPAHLVEKVGVWAFIEGADHPIFAGLATSPNDSSAGRPSSFDDWLQAFKEQATFFTGVKFDTGTFPAGPLSDVLPVLPFIGAAVGLAAGLVFAIVRGVSGPGWLAGVLAVVAAVLITRALHEDGSGRHRRRAWAACA